MKAQAGVSYVWTAEPPFSNNAVPTASQIKYSPYMTKRLTITGKNDCGSASASTTMVITSVKGKSEVFH
jgi:hypothetical protein